ncbi:MAG: NAD(P)/FAD-dependent oxidoreductase [Blastocatellia bacterium]
MSDYDCIIIGGGPAGTSAAIVMAERGVRVLVLEEKRMPRGKLCGEFITPESFPTLKRLGVMNRMLDEGAQKITHLSLVVSNGKTVHTPISGMSKVASWAMSLSRARFDQVLFERAREAGATCLEAIAVKQCLFDDDKARGVEAMSLADGKTVKFEAPLILDASGRSSRFMVGRSERIGGQRGSRLYALKGHLSGVEGITEQVELYFFPQGYGGLSLVENGLVNLCFIANERTFKSSGGDAEKIIEHSIKNNRLARERLSRAQVSGKWYTVGPLVFGRRRLSQNGVIAIGDASGMIDPFTGTGIQIALRTGELVAESVIASMHTSSAKGEGRSAQELFQNVVARYSAAYEVEFGKRMKMAGLLRTVAFSTATANFLASLLAISPGLARRVLLATRSGAHAEGDVRGW